jgi:2-dehydro-3-deoxyphosphogluconate aldolase/(4S)-4-hydroxy-2-oxoglutarate aldolase
LTVPNALKVVEEVTRRFGQELIVGAGTVLNIEDCEAAIQAGAQFIVSPATDPKVIKVSRQQGIVSMPGALTPTEVLIAMQSGADLVKIFPADTAGGPRYIRALKGPFPQIEFVPSGGVDMSNIAEYLASGAVAVSIGSLIFDPKALSEGRSDVIAEKMQSFSAAVQSRNGYVRSEA